MGFIIIIIFFFFFFLPYLAHIFASIPSHSLTRKGKVGFTVFKSL